MRTGGDEIVVERERVWAFEMPPAGVS